MKVDAFQNPATKTFRIKHQTAERLSNASNADMWLIWLHYRVRGYASSFVDLAMESENRYRQEGAILGRKGDPAMTAAKAILAALFTLLTLICGGAAQSD